MDASCLGGRIGQSFRGLGNSSSSDDVLPSEPHHTLSSKSTSSVGASSGSLVLGGAKLGVDLSGSGCGVDCSLDKGCDIFETAFLRGDMRVVSLGCLGLELPSGLLLLSAGDAFENSSLECPRDLSGARRICLFLPAAFGGSFKMACVSSSLLDDSSGVCLRSLYVFGGFLRGDVLRVDAMCWPSIFLLV